ncbi:hypothetical protein ACFQJ5_15685 [Halomicroarcula sp. GCM10025324]|nr:hypothetical protein [Halomicroarcula sp. ZS-22-S1]
MPSVVSVSPIMGPTATPTAVTPLSAPKAFARSHPVSFSTIIE